MTTIILLTTGLVAGANSYAHYKSTKHWISFILLASVLITAFVETITASLIIHNLQNYNKIDPKDRFAYDFFHSILPYNYNFYYHTIVLLILCTVGCIFRSYYDRIFREKCLISISVLYMLRNISTVLTNIPLTQFDVDGDVCLPLSELPFVIIWKKALSLQIFECGDYFFSGHMIMATLGIIACWIYCKTIATKVLVSLLYLYMILALLISRAHYSIDILFGIILTYVFYYVFSDPLCRYIIKHLYPETICVCGATQNCYYCYLSASSQYEPILD